MKNMTKILVIEDDASVLDNILDTLEAAGYQVNSASNGRIGLEYLRKQIPDLIICDVMMPEITGYEVLKTIRKDRKTTAIPFIFLTAKIERSDQRGGMELGADDYLTKPFTQRELLSAIETQLQKRTTIAEKYETSLHLLRKNIVYALPHELRTPLSHILGYAEMLKMDAATAPPSSIENMADAILKGGTRLQRLIENYLVYAQIEIMSGNPTEIEGLLNHVIKDASTVISQTSKRTAENYGRIDDLFLELNPAAIRISEENFAKVIGELVDNAFKFSVSGTKIQIKSLKQQQQFSIAIRDYGRGMNENDIQHLGPYMQFDREFYEQQGLGLGFVIAKRLIELHGGKIEVKSMPNKGTLAHVCFPI
jgi:two-component system sensor histidine kinase/response regulator